MTFGITLKRGKSLTENVDGVAVLSQVVCFEFLVALPQRGSLGQVLEVRVVQAVLCPERYLPLNFLEKLTLDIIQFRHAQSTK